MARFGTAALAAVVGLCVAQGAQAAQYSEISTGVGDPYSSQGFFNFPDYDGRYGPLGGASISLNLFLTATEVFDATSLPGGQNTASVTFHFSYLGFQLSGTAQSQVLLLPNAFRQVTGTFSADYALSGVFPDSLLSALTFPGNTDQFEADALPTINGRHGTEQSSYNLTEVATITYSSAPLPEPATLALFAVGAVGLRTVRRRQAARS